jgi:hypothetical protein
MADDIYVTVTEESSTTVTTVGEQGLSSTSGNLEEIPNVDITSNGLLDGSLLIYSTATSKWVAGLLLEKQEITGGHY